MRLRIDCNWLAACLAVVTIAFGTGCTTSTGEAPEAQTIKVFAIESFLADIAQRVAGDAFIVQPLIPQGLDPHAYEPTPKDLAEIAGSDILIFNGAGLESWLRPTLENVGGQQLVIEASEGVPSRNFKPAVAVLNSQDHAENAQEIDPHFWLDPNLVMRYVANIRDGFSSADPGRKSEYDRNAEEYIDQLRQLDGWIRQQVEIIPVENRVLVTNHESFGYFADRYGFHVIGTIIPSVSTGVSPSAQHMAQLIDMIKQSGAKAIFLETGTNPDLAEQIASETGVKVVYGLSSHSLASSSGELATYIGLIKNNVRLIVEALK